MTKTSSDTPLEQLKRSGVLHDLDLHFARFIAGFEEQANPNLDLAAALLCQRVREGDLCIDIHREAGERWPEDGPEALTLPPAQEWLAALTKSASVARSDWDEDRRFRPLVLDEAGRLYLHKYHRWELELARDLLARHHRAAEAIDEKGLQDGLQRLFGSSDQPDRQRLAAMVAVLRRFAIISGGPGTGKTTTVVRILALILEQAQAQTQAETQGHSQQPPIIALAAPTGKAAVRLQESIRRQKASLDVSPAVREAIPEKVVTLHRLLGARPDSVHFRHDRENPLAVDILVVDEASMVDLALMARLLQALPPDARLILLGDKDQLASVEAGAVLGDLCRDAAGFSEPFSKRLAQLGAAGIPTHSAPSPIADALVVLDHSYRFSNEQGIGRLAAAINQGQAKAGLTWIDDPASPQVSWLPQEQDPARHAADRYAELLRLIQQRQTPIADLFQRFDAFRCLCALREGEYGVNGINRRIEQYLVQDGLIPRDAALWYPGRPLMITRNDYNLKLFNGDIGLLLPDPEEPQRLAAWFPMGEEHFRPFAPARLPAHETAFAITVHKSQGSEFGEILLALPPKDAPVITRELLYTALTRARHTCLFSGQPQLLASWIGRRVERVSGLGDRFR
jgi:exodeoxyribonuclease V alpha subunit